MTKAQISAFTKRIAAKIARGEISMRPLSDAQKRRFEQLRKREQSSDESGAALSSI